MLLRHMIGKTEESKEGLYLFVPFSHQQQLVDVLILISYTDRDLQYVVG